MMDAEDHAMLSFECKLFFKIEFQSMIKTYEKLCFLEDS